MRTVVSFAPLGQGTTLTLVEAPGSIPGAGTSEFTELPVPVGTLVQRGTVLRDLLALHSSVGQGMASAVALPAGAPPNPIYFHVVSERADELAWEELFDPENGFLALDSRWPIGRIAKVVRPVPARSFVPPLRIVAVLSAAREDGTKQLQGLLRAATTPAAASIGVHVHVISAQQAVLDAVHAAGLAEVTAEVLPATAPELESRITAARPHLLHLLCHGGAVAGVRTLAFAHTGDFEAEAPTGSVLLKLPQLVSVLKPSAAWLVVLCACQSAQATDGPALAHDLVSNGIAAVAGMRRMVDLHDTDRFCAALYPEVVAAVGRAVTTGAQEAREIDWAAAFTAPRVVLAGADPEQFDAWTDPVLYVQRDPLRVFPGSPTLSPAAFATLRGVLDFWEEFMARLDPATADPALLAHAEAQIAAVRAQLAEEGP
ncbi:CHAT domain-containing protein [Streptomyces sp. NPDC093225]|uniref:CHAT domain-containing protein n=1 Tax=Streptomyces sp. NPDC093225 TaxID=3366034 RepID=UPI0038221F42